MILSLLLAPLLFALYIETSLYGLDVATDASVATVAATPIPTATAVLTAYHPLTVPYSITHYEHKQIVPYTAPTNSLFTDSKRDLFLGLAAILLVYLLCVCMANDNRYSAALVWRSLMIEKLEPLKSSLDRCNDMAAAESLMELSRSTLPPTPPPSVEQLTPSSSGPSSPTLRRSLRHLSQAAPT
jgi:hypothetical protein